MQVQIPKNNMIETPQLNTTANDTSDISANTNSANVDSTAKPMSTQTGNTTTTEPASTNETPQLTAIKDQATAAKMQRSNCSSRSKFSSR